MENASDISAFEGITKDSIKLPVSNNMIPYKIVGSCWHMSEETGTYIEKREAEQPQIELGSKGSSLKYVWLPKVVQMIIRYLSYYGMGHSSGSCNCQRCR